MHADLTLSVHSEIMTTSPLKNKVIINDLIISLYGIFFNRYFTLSYVKIGSDSVEIGN